MTVPDTHQDGVEQVHLLFRGAAEFAKRLRRIAYGLDGVVGAVAVYLVFIDDATLATWQPLVAFLVVVLARALRTWSKESARFAEGCRRESARAYACGRTIGPARVSDLSGDAPSGAVRIARGLPASTMEEYYEPTCPVGELRLREMYANSAFHTWRLTRSWSWYLAAYLAILTVLSVAAIYGLAVTDGDIADRSEFVDVLFSFVLVLFWVEGAEAFFSTLQSFRNVRAIFRKFVGRPLPTGDYFQDLVRDYDFERTGSPAVPTFLYKLNREGLAAEWANCRREFEC